MIREPLRQNVPTPKGRSGICEVNNSDEILLIHMGGLGDVCLSEAAFLTISLHFGKGIRAVGSKSVLEQFSVYFTHIDSMDARAWAYLFSDSSQGRRWKRILFFGKDREGTLRARLNQLANEPIFIDLYPDRERTPVERTNSHNSLHMEWNRRSRSSPTGRRGASSSIPRQAFRRKMAPGTFCEGLSGLKERGVNVNLIDATRA